VIDITCPSCDITYHADENHLGRGFRCKVCGKILRVERPPSSLSNRGPEILNRIITESESKHTDRNSRTMPIVVGILATLVGIGIGIGYRESTRVSAPAASTNSNSASAIEAATQRLNTEVESQQRNPSPVQTEAKRVPTRKPLPLVPVNPSLALGVTKPITNERSLPPKAAPLVIVPACAQGQEPEVHMTGDRIESDSGTDGKSKLFVENGLDVDAALRISDVATGRTTRFVYIQAHDQYTITAIEPGNYIVRFFQGKDWIKNCRFFLHKLRVQKFKEPFEFSVKREEDEESVNVTVRNFRISLNPVLLGNAKTEEINLKDFFDEDQNVTIAH
jgi:hypothetical protein